AGDALRGKPRRRCRDQLPDLRTPVRVPHRSLPSTTQTGARNPAAGGLALYKERVMPRGVRRVQPATPDAEALARELEELKARQKEIKQQLRGMRGGATESREPEEKLAKQLDTAKRADEQIGEQQPTRDEPGVTDAIRR